MKIFIDTGPLVAFFTPLDQFHSATLKMLNQLENKHAQLVTTNDIVEETLTAIITKRKGGYRFTVILLNWLFNKTAAIHMEWIDQRRFFEAIRTFRQYNKDKRWSFADCTSYVVIKELKIDQVFTFDEHFKQMGFSILS